LPVSLDGEQILFCFGGDRLKAVNQPLFMVASQPGSPAAFHQPPDQMDACGDVGPAIDDVTAKHQVIVRWQDRHQTKQHVVTSVHVTDDPVMAPLGRHFQRFDPLILTI
jgi:hypothetical protein